jgi:hypothetical protein
MCVMCHTSDSATSLVCTMIRQLFSTFNIYGITHVKELLRLQCMHETVATVHIFDDIRLSSAIISSSLSFSERISPRVSFMLLCCAVFADECDFAA